MPQQPDQQRSLPASLALAVKVMYVGALASAVFAVVGLTQRGAVRDATVKAAAQQHRHFTPEQIDQAVNAAINRSMILGAVSVLLWIWMALANTRGKAWVRGVSTMLAMFGVVSFVFSLFAAGSVVGLLIGGIVVALGVFAVFLLWRRDSTEFYAQQAELNA